MAISFVGSMFNDLEATTATSVELTYASISAGTVTANDIVIVQLQIDAVGQTITPPAGFTLIGSKTEIGGDQTQAFYWARYSSGSAFTFSWTSSVHFEIICPVFRGCATSGSPIDVNATETGTANLLLTGATHAGVTTTKPGDMVVLSYANDEGFIWTTPSTWTSALTTMPVGEACFYKLFASAGATGSVNAKSTAGTTSPYLTSMIALKEPEASVAGKSLAMVV